MAMISRLLQNEYYQGKHYPGKNIFLKLEAVCADPMYQNIVCQLEIAPDLLSSVLSRFVFELYAGTGDFTMLHAVTSNHALRLVIPYVRSKNYFAVQYWNALLAAYISIGCPSIEYSPFSRTNLPSWEKIFHKSIGVSDAHVIKFVYTCYRESKEYAWTEYQALAYRKLSEYLKL